MKITIYYDSCWRNSFLDGDNNEPLPKKGRKYIASITNLKNNKNFIQRNISKNTVIGILNRLIGDQRKLYQSRKSESYYFADIENKISFSDNPQTTQEMTYLRNISGSTDQNSFTGAIKSNDTMFNSDYSKELWGVLALNLDELFDFIVNNSIVDKTIRMDPLSLSEIMDNLSKLKKMENVGIVANCTDILQIQFPYEVKGEIKNGYIDKNGFAEIKRFYFAALYIQLERLEKKYNMDDAKTKSGKISGISKRGFTKKDFMDRFTTGEKKKIWGNPYIHETFVKGEGKTRNLMVKASGVLNIVVDISRDKAKEIRSMINDAGVSSFYLGKKGLAFVDGEISIKEIAK